MAQNINIIQYALMPPGGPWLAPAGQTYQLPAISLIGEISFRRSDKRKITEHKRSRGITVGLQGDAIYRAWRDAVKDQMLARGYQTDLHHFPDSELLQIVTGFRQLRPTCDELATASAANDTPGMQEVDEAVVQVVKDCGKKLTNTINLQNKPFPQVPGVPPAQVMVPNILLAANTPSGSQCGLATAVQNAGAGAPNPPTANVPGPAQFQPAQATGPYQILPPPPNSQGPIQLPLPASGNPGPSGSTGQNIPPPAMRPLKLRLRLSASTLKISGAASANNPQQMFPHIVVNNQRLNNPPQTAGGANQIQAPPLNPQRPNQPPSTASANAGLSGNQIQAPPLNTQGPNQPPSTASANAGPSANQIQPLPANSQGAHQPPSRVSAGPGPSGRATQNNPLPVIAPEILRLRSSGVRMHKMGAPLVNNPPQIQPAAPLTILGTPAPANYEAQIIRHTLDQPNVRQNAPDLCDVRQISECFSKFPQ